MDWFLFDIGLCHERVNKGHKYLFFIKVGVANVLLKLKADSEKNEEIHACMIETQNIILKMHVINFRIYKLSVLLNI